MIAPTASQVGAAAGEPGYVGEIQDLLDVRADAVARDDRRAFLNTIDDRSRAFATRQRDSFGWMAALPLASYDLELAWERSGNLARPSDVSRYRKADRVVIAAVEERYRIEGFDPEEAVEDLFFTFVEIGGRWAIANDADLDDLTLYSGRHIWDFGPLVTRRSPHFMLVSHPCASSAECASTAHDYLGLAEQALKRVERYWRGPFHKRILIMVPDDEAELARMLQSTFDLDNFVAFAYSTVDLSGAEEGNGGVDYVGHRILLNPEGFEGRSTTAVLQIMAHELLHVASRNSAGPFVPIFVDEGFADYVGNDADPAGLSFFNSEVAQGLFNGELPEDFEFTVGSGTDIYRSYQKAQSAARFFIERYGLDKFVEFYRDLGRKGFVAGTVRFHLDRSLRRTIGIGLDRFERAWADSIG